MNSKVVIRLTLDFQKEIKRLSRKYPSLKSDLLSLRDNLFQDPRIGTPLGNNTFKIRLAIKSKGKGKSGGARIISLVETEIIAKIENTTVNLLTIYDKSEVHTVSLEKILALVKKMKFE